MAEIYNIDFEKLGFFKEFPDDVDVTYYHWRLNIKHFLIKDLHVICDKEVITVWAKEPSKKINGLSASINGSASILLIYEKLTKNKLTAILKSF